MTADDAGAEIILRELTDDDVRVIHRWPRYPAALSRLDYALRPGGWLDQFPQSASSMRFAAWKDNDLVGFSMLTDIEACAAEFYIAIHPDWLGRSYGRGLTRATVREGFAKLGLRKIYLKVRDWHSNAAALYESEGFKKRGTRISDVQGQPVNFVEMEVSFDDWDRKPHK